MAQLEHSESLGSHCKTPPLACRVGYTFRRTCHGFLGNQENVILVILKRNLLVLAGSVSPPCVLGKSAQAWTMASAEPPCKLSTLVVELIFQSSPLVARVSCTLFVSLTWVVIIAQKKPLLHVVPRFSIALMCNKPQE